MTIQLFTFDGKRKYLTEKELNRFIAKAAKQDRAEVRTFCLVLAHTGCRISEALEITPKHVDMTQGTITLRTLKQGQNVRFRSVPVPDSTLDALELVHAIRKGRRSKRKNDPIWSWGRTQAWKHVKAVMDQAGIEGAQASPKGLRHGFGVRATQVTRNPRLVQKWLGHTSLETTTIYMDVIDQEERSAALEMWI
jgi:integrase/recombinase XerD